MPFFSALCLSQTFGLVPYGTYVYQNLVENYSCITKPSYSVGFLSIRVTGENMPVIFIKILNFTINQLLEKASSQS